MSIVCNVATGPRGRRGTERAELHQRQVAGRESTRVAMMIRVSTSATPPYAAASSTRSARAARVTLCAPRPFLYLLLCPHAESLLRCAPQRPTSSFHALPFPLHDSPTIPNPTSHQRPLVKSSPQHPTNAHTHAHNLTPNHEPRRS